MAADKAVFRMESVGGNGIYNVFYRHKQIGQIRPWDESPGEWIFRSEWNGRVWSGTSLSECKKKAKQAHKDWLKSQKR